MVNPIVTVLIPFVEINNYLIDTVESIVINDTLDSEIILISNSDKYTQIEIENTIKNLFKKINLKVIIQAKKGISYALNSGLEESNGKYILRIDSDDILVSNRIEKQVMFLDNNSNYSAVGGNVLLINEVGKMIKIKKMPSFNNILDLYDAIKVENPFIHPAMMIRKNVLEKYRYSENYMGCEDYHLWYRMIQDGHLLTNLNEVVIKYRIHEHQTSRKNNDLISNSLKTLIDSMEIETRGYYWYRKSINKNKPKIIHYYLHLIRIFKSKSFFSKCNLLKQLFY